MTNEQWQKERKSNPLSASAFFEYYREMGGKLDNIDEFVRSLYSKYLVDRVPHLMSNGRIVEASRAENKVREYYDEKFKG